MNATMEDMDTCDRCYAVVPEWLFHRHAEWHVKIGDFEE